jgi:hypothetical protein
MNEYIEDMIKELDNQLRKTRDHKEQNSIKAAITRYQKMLRKVA